MKNFSVSKLICLVLICTLSISFFSGCSDNVHDQLDNIKDANNEYVLMVKGGHPEAYPNITYEKAFADFFSAPTWKYFESDTGKQVVEFTGDCIYMDTEVKARLQFVVDTDAGTFEATALSFNDVPQNALIIMALISNAFEGQSEFVNIPENDTLTESSSVETSNSDEKNLSESSTVESPLTSEVTLNYLFDMPLNKYLNTTYDAIVSELDEKGYYDYFYGEDGMGYEMLCVPTLDERQGIQFRYDYDAEIVGPYISTIEVFESEGDCSIGGGFSTGMSAITVHDTIRYNNDVADWKHGLGLFNSYCGAEIVLNEGYTIRYYWFTEESSEGNADMIEIFSSAWIS